jgi:hypothetical protein
MFVLLISVYAGNSAGIDTQVIPNRRGSPASGTESPPPMAADSLKAPVANSTTFVWAAVGDSFASGEGAPETGIANPLDHDNFTGLSWGHDSTTVVPNPHAHAVNGKHTFSRSPTNKDVYTVTSTGVAGRPRSQRDKENDDRFSCHRSDLSGPAQAHAKLKARYGHAGVDGVQFRMANVACTGAKIKHLIDTDWIGSLGDRRERSYEAHHALVADGSFDSSRHPITSGGPGSFLQTTQPPQLSRVATWKASNGGQLDAIYANIGGNDLDDRSYARMMANFCPTCSVKIDTSVYETNGQFIDDITGIWVLSTADRAKRLLGQTVPNQTPGHKSYADLNASIASRGLDRTPGFRVLVNKGPKLLSKAAGTGTIDTLCQATDYTRTNGADVGLPSSKDVMYTVGNLDGEEPRMINSTAPEGLNAVISTVAAPFNAARNPFGLGWVAVAEPDFRGHGLCVPTAQRYANLNSDALARQGFDMLPGEWWQGAIGFQPSFGISHPNAAGYSLYGYQIEAAFRMNDPLTGVHSVLTQKVIDGLRPPAAQSGNTPYDGIRVGEISAGSITIDWDDRATSENGYDVRIMPANALSADPARMGTMPGGCTAVGGGATGNGWHCPAPGVNVQSYKFIFPGSGSYRFAVRACNTGLSNLGGRDAQCGSWSPEVSAVNNPAGIAVPTGLSVTHGVGTCISGPVVRTCPYTSTLRWSVSEFVQEYVVRVFNSSDDTLFTSVRLHGSAITGSLGFSRNNTPRPYHFDIAACNQGWCSKYSLDVH